MTSNGKLTKIDFGNQSENIYYSRIKGEKGKMEMYKWGKRKLKGKCTKGEEGKLKRKCIKGEKRMIC